MNRFNVLLSSAALAAGLALAAAAPASAASFFCQANASINDVGPLQQVSGAGSCAATAGQGVDNAPHGFAATSGTAGVLRGGAHAETADPHSAGFVVGRTYVEARDNVVVSGLGDDGAILRFNVHVDGDLSSNAAGATQFYRPTATSDFRAFVFINSSRGLSSSNELFDCTRNPEPGISVCDFPLDAPMSETVSAFMPLSIFVRNGDVLDVGLTLRTDALATVQEDGASARASSHFGHTLFWDGLQFDDATRNVVLTSDTGFDYRFSAFPATGSVPEPAAWALMILGFGSAGTMLRHRRRALAA